MSQPEVNDLASPHAAAHTAHPHPVAKPAKPPRPVPSQIVFYSYPKFLYTWPVILLALVLPQFGEHLLNPQLEGWIFVITLLTVLMAMGFDLSRNLTITWGVALLASVFCLLWLKDAKNVVVFSQIGHHLASKNPLISHDWLDLFGLFGGLLYLIMYIDVHVNQRWRISHNEIEHFAMLSKDDSLGRGAKRFITSYPDFLELLLCGAGTIQIYSAQGGILLRSIPNVPWLFFRSKRISQILESTEVSAASGEEDVDLHEGQPSSEELGDGHGG
ncbi:MAG: hypothetical protein DVB25_08710 [Verrucomicrobia bacterium]|nr:MAG: hypothetical protein DVB25_08710 [Verrucomicrobiota bacterium]